MHDLDRLKMLIGLYQKEARDLKKLISISIKEWKYMMADHYAQRLRQVNRELQILQTILDPDYGEKQILIRQITHYKKNRSLAGQKNLRELYEQWIGDAEKKLEGLNSNVNPDAPFSRVVADLLEKLKLYNLICIQIIYIYLLKCFCKINGCKCNSTSIFEIKMYIFKLQNLWKIKRSQ